MAYLREIGLMQIVLTAPEQEELSNQVEKALLNFMSSTEIDTVMVSTINTACQGFISELLLHPEKK